MNTLGMFGGMAKWTRIFGGMPKSVGIFGVKIQGQKGAYAANERDNTAPPPNRTHPRTVSMKLRLLGNISNFHNNCC